MGNVYINPILTQYMFIKGPFGPVFFELKCTLMEENPRSNAFSFVTVWLKFMFLKMVKRLGFGTQWEAAF